MTKGAQADVPIFAELGYPQLTETSWVALSAAELARDVREASARQAQVLRAIGFRPE